MEENVKELWIADSPWQNFSSMYREAITAQESRTGMERAHHLTASLYFGIAALEAFLNEKMRERLGATESEDQIVEELKRHRSIRKVKQWPFKLLRKHIKVDEKVIEYFNDLRGELTHPKRHAQQIYERLEAVDPMSIVDAIGDYIVSFHEAAGTHFPYWVFGWNYLNPRPNSYQIFPMNETQFWTSLQALGFASSSAVNWSNLYFGTFDGYIEIRQFLRSIDRCQPKSIFPHLPILCRRWWTSEHQQSCGRVTAEAVARARSRWR